MFKKALVAQGGGPTAVINQSVIGVVLECRKFPQIERIYGALHGVRGIVDEDFLDLTQETTQNLELVAETTPSSALGSTRDKPDQAYCHEIFETLKAHEIGYFFYVGGNDSSDTVRIVAEEAKAAELPAALDPHPEDRGQRHRRERPHAGLPLGRTLRRPGLHGDQSRQQGAARRLHRRRHGPQCRLPHRRLGLGQEVPG